MQKMHSEKSALVYTQVIRERWLVEVFSALRYGRIRDSFYTDLMC